MMQTNRRTALSDLTAAQVRDRVAFADAGLALAGHEVTDEFSRDVMQRVAREEISADDAVEQIRAHFQH